MRVGARLCLVAAGVGEFGGHESTLVFRPNVFGHGLQGRRRARQRRTPTDKSAEATAEQTPSAETDCYLWRDLVCGGIQHPLLVVLGTPC